MKKAMSPNSKFNDSDVTRGVINGPRPLPLRISKDSHVIQKAPPNHQPSAAAAAKRQPVIIYTHSPKVIHAAPNNFMKLVQRLTGLSEDGDDAAAGSDAAVKAEAEAVKEEDGFSDDKGASSSSGSGGFGNNSGRSYEENCETTSSVLADDRRFVVDAKQDPAAAAMYKMSNAYLVEAEPLFTAAAGSNDFYCSPRTSSVFQSAMAASAISPSYMDYMKAFPDY